MERSERTKQRRNKISQGGSHSHVCVCEKEKRGRGEEEGEGRGGQDSVERGDTKTAVSLVRHRGLFI